MSEKKIIAAVVAHADDETIGAAGTLALHARKGDEVHIIVLADGVSSRGSQDELEVRNQAAQKAAEIIDAQRIYYAKLPDNKMDSLPLLEIVQTLETILETIQPDIIYTHHYGDLNIDHRLTHEAVLTACRAMPGAKTQAIYGFEVLSSTEWSSPIAQNAFLPVHFVDISTTFAIKMQALECYDMEMRDFPHSRSYQAVEAKATLRGAQVGLEKAEAFTVIRQIVRQT